MSLLVVLRKHLEESQAREAALRERLREEVARLEAWSAKTEERDPRFSLGLYEAAEKIEALLDTEQEGERCTCDDPPYDSDCPVHPESGEGEARSDEGQGWTSLGWREAKRHKANAEELWAALSSLADYFQRIVNKQPVDGLDETAQRVHESLSRLAPLYASPQPDSDQEGSE